MGRRRTAASILPRRSCSRRRAGDSRRLVENETLDARLASAREVQLKQGPKAALSLYDGIIATARANNDRKHEALALGHLGTAYKNLGDYPRAMDLQRQALAIKRQLGDQIEIAKTLSNIGLIEDAQGRCAQALELYGESLAIFTRLKAAGFSASVLNNQGLCYDTLGDYRESTAVYERALALHRQAGNEAGESESLGNLGGVALLLGRYPEAAKDYEQSLAISTRLDIKQSMALDLINLGLARMGTSEFHEAREHLERARTIAHDAGLLREEADAARGLGDWLAHAGRFDDARKALDEASASLRAGGTVPGARGRDVFAWLAGPRHGRSRPGGRDPGARLGRRRAPEVPQRSTRRRARLDRARAAPAQRRLRLSSRANRARQSAAAVGNQASVASALTWLSRIQQTQGHYGPAREAASAALEAALSTASPTLVAEARIVLGDALIGDHKPVGRKAAI